MTQDLSHYVIYINKCNDPFKKLHCDCYGQNKTQMMVKFHFPLGNFTTQLKTIFCPIFKEIKLFFVPCTF